MPKWINSPLCNLRLWLPLFVLFASCGPSQIDYGTSPSERPVETLQNLVERSAEFLDQEVAVGGEIVEVCQTAGCWCILADGQERLYVTMLTFSLPPEVAGSRCLAEGKLVEKDGRLTLIATGIRVFKG
ncbi:MAG: hypothetical protein JSU96_17430 [Acidobacteriota bacterium]|nr:MAG: hypothetical protein JSU96_17430 [Acidobacteriota bacterium]